jgi:AcrR family transcriptional regulator/DNA-binding MarR family transcriptional regulator
MANLQRARLVLAAAEVIEEVGYARMTVSLVITRARVSRTTFYDLFASREDCFVAVLEGAVERATRLAGDSYAQQTSWRKGMRAAVAAILALIDAEPGLARVCVIETLAGGPRILSLRMRLMREIADALDLGRGEPTSLRDPPAITAEACAGGLAAVLHNKLSEGSEQQLIALLGALMSMITLPYLGARVAAEELKKPMRDLPRLNGHLSRPEVDPFHALGTRLTYRTTCALMAIAEHPGSSNRDIGRQAGIADDGQISKLLRRLSRLGLIANTGAGQRNGSTNSWWLTERGERLLTKAWSRAGGASLER